MNVLLADSSWMPVVGGVLLGFGASRLYNLIKLRSLPISIFLLSSISAATASYFLEYSSLLQENKITDSWLLSPEVLALHPIADGLLVMAALSALFSMTYLIFERFFERD